MKKELDEALVRDFPNLYSQRHNRKHSIYFGFDVGDGWEPLIRRLASQLEKLILQLPEEERSKYFCVQCKQKLAGLRHYMSAKTAEMAEAIEEAENESYKTCERCGKFGTQKETDGGWIYIECDRCALLK